MPVGREGEMVGGQYLGDEGERGRDIRECEGEDRWEGLGRGDGRG